MHLIAFFIHSPINHTVMSWAQAGDRRLEGLRSFAHWQGIARTLERGCFDGIFFADFLRSTTFTMTARTRRSNTASAGRPMIR